MATGAHYLVNAGRARGYAAVGLLRPKRYDNVGGTLRAAFCFGAAAVFIEDDRSGFDAGLAHPTNTARAERHIPVVRCERLQDVIPVGCVPIAVDLVDDAELLHSFQHPKNAFYVFGPEDGTLGDEVLSWCAHRLMVPTRGCLNLHATVNVVLYDRQAKALRAARKEAA